MGLGKKVFVQSRPNGGALYQWSPPPNDVGGNRQIKKGNEKPYYCSATPYSQGQDWVTTYVYDVNVVNYEQHRDAYVECDYVK